MNTVIFLKKSNIRSRRLAFSLVEMVAVIAVLAILVTAAAALMGGSGPQARKAGADMMAGRIEQARTMAITSRCHVLLAVAEPGDLPSVDERCRIGLFKVKSWPEAGATATLSGVLMSRWQPLEPGIVLTGGEVEGMQNPLDAGELTITYGAEKSLNVTVHAVSFNPHGGLRYPAGSNPVAMRVAEGSYRGGKATPGRRGPSGTTAESLIKIGRVTARPYRVD